MYIKSLIYFQKIAEIKSISKVAKNSHISQPALSQQIQKLEDSLNTKLFVRSNRGVQLTEQGKIVLKYADNIIRTYDKMLSDLNEKESREIKIEGEHTIATYCLPCVILNMQFKFPNHEYNLISASCDKIEQDVSNDICEIGFTTHPIEDENLNYQNVINEKVVLISPPSYNIPEKIKLKEVIDYKFIILQGDCIIKENFKDGLKENGYSIDDIEIISRLDSTEALKSIVKKGFGVAFVPYNSVKNNFDEDKIKISRIEDYNLDYDIYMTYKKAKFLSKEAKEFISKFNQLGKHICY